MALPLTLDPKLRSLLIRHEGRILTGMGGADLGPVIPDEGLEGTPVLFSYRPSPNQLPSDQSDYSPSVRVLIEFNRDAVPAELSHLTWIHIVERVYAVHVPTSYLSELASRPDVSYVEAGRPLTPSLDVSLRETRVDVVHRLGRGPAFDGSGVVVGIIDHGFDYTLADFREPKDDTTRVAFLWDQSLDPLGNERFPRNYPYGVEYDREAINHELAQPGSRVRHRPEAPRTHGTLVAGIAVGNGRTGDAQFPAGRYVGVAPGATIVFVQPRKDLPPRALVDSVAIIETLGYIFEQADALNMPCVVNLSLSSNAGSHDGETMVERAIDQLLEKKGRAVIVAAGNEHNRHGHASGRLTPEQPERRLRWKLGGLVFHPGQSPNLDTLEIWYSSLDRFSVQLISPAGEVSPAVFPGDVNMSLELGEDQVFITSERFTKLNGDARIHIDLPTRGREGTRPPLTWTIILNAVECRDGRFDAWIERARWDSRDGSADQSIFPGNDFDRLRTLGTPATARRVIAVGNYNPTIESVHDASGRGPTRDGRNKPELAAPGTNIKSTCAFAGVEDPRSQTGAVPARHSATGTSMSAPHVTGIVALMLQKNPSMTAAQIRKILLASARRPANVEGFDPGWGFGMVDAWQALELVPEPGRDGW
jgi:subtilisin family serine protease